MQGRAVSSSGPSTSEDVRKGRRLPALGGSCVERRVAGEKDQDKANFFKRLYRASLHRVLERMRALGFWPTGVALPPDPPEEARERAAIEKELAELAQLSGAAGKIDPKKALQQERVRRWNESKQRRAQRRAEVEAKAKQLREAYATLKQGTVVHAGEGVSGALEKKQTNRDELLRRGLPLLETAAELAAAIGVSLPHLRWLT